MKEKNTKEKIIIKQRKTKHIKSELKNINKLMKKHTKDARTKDEYTIGRDSWYCFYQLFMLKWRKSNYYCIIRQKR